MNKKVLLSVLTATLLLGSTWQVSAAEDHATLSFEADNQLIYSEADKYGDGGAKLGTSFEGIAPGETATQTITIENKNARTADFYMDAEALRALEDTKDKAKGAGYDIQLTAGTDTLYDSTAGGYASNTAGGSREGIKSMNDGALEGFVLVGTLKPGETEDVVLNIHFDGEAMDNTDMVSDYSETLGQLGFTFKVSYEDPESPEIIYKTVNKKGENRIVRKLVTLVEDGVPLAAVPTGDSSLIGVALAGLAAGVAVVLFANRKKRKTEGEK